MSEISDKVLGKESRKRRKSCLKETFPSGKIWKVSKSGCGTSFLRDDMVFEMLDAKSKHKMLAGERMFSCNGFDFECFSGE